MKTQRLIRDHLRALFGDETGTTTIYSVVMLVLILSITGASVDIMRLESVRATMQTAMDRAVLAAADLDQDQDPRSVVSDYLAKAGLEATLKDVTPHQGLNYRTVAAEASTEVDTIFLKMMGMDTMTAPASSTAEEKISNVEISLVLDISGSMRFNNRILRLQPAATNFVEKVMTDESNGVTTLNIVPFAGQVNPGDILFDYFRGERPLIQQPDVAPDADPEPVVEEPLTDDGDYFPAWEQAISNVVFYFDTDGDDIYNRAHKIQRFPEDASRDVDDFLAGAVAYIMTQDASLTEPGQFLGASIKGGKKRTRYFQVKGDLNGTTQDHGPKLNRGRIPGKTFKYNNISFANYEPDYVSPNVFNPNADEQAVDIQEERVDDTNVNMPSSCVEIYDAEFDTTAMPQSEDYVPHFHYWATDEETMDWGWCPSEEMSIQYYSADKQRLVDFIDNIRLHDGTGTQYGMKYGLALLDPVNRPALSELINAGIVDDRFIGRPIDWHDDETEKYIVLMSDGATTDQFRPVDYANPLNGSEELTAQGSGSYTWMTSASNNVSNFHSQCALAKANGVTVFTIAFETSNSAANTLGACASSASHAFHVKGNVTIDDTFDAIARQINNLRLIQ